MPVLTPGHKSSFKGFVGGLLAKDIRFCQPLMLGPGSDGIETKAGWTEARTGNLVQDLHLPESFELHGIVRVLLGAGTCNDRVRVTLGKRIHPCPAQGRSTVLPSCCRAHRKRPTRGSGSSKRYALQGALGQGNSFDPRRSVLGGCDELVRPIAQDSSGELDKGTFKTIRWAVEKHADMPENKLLPAKGGFI